MGAGRYGDASDRFIGERNAVELPFSGVVFVRDEVDIPVLLIEAEAIPDARPESAAGSDFPIAARQLLEHFSLRVINIDVPETVSLAHPKEALAIAKKADRKVAHVDPITILLGDNHARFPSAGVGDEQVELFLRSVEPFNEQRLAIWHPIDARQINVRVRARVDPFRRASHNRLDADAHNR